MKLTEDIIRKHAKLIETTVTVKGHVRHSSKGKAFNVKTYQRELTWSGDAKNGGTATAIHPGGSFTISKVSTKEVSGYSLSRSGVHLHIYNTENQAKAAAEKMVTKDKQSENERTRYTIGDQAATRSQDRKDYNKAKDALDKAFAGANKGPMLGISGLKRKYGKK